MQVLYLLALNPIAETTGDRNSYGFRPERSTADAIEQCFNVLSHNYSAQWVLEGDIKACFDGIQPYMVRGSYPDGQEHSEQMAEGRLHRQAASSTEPKKEPRREGQFHPHSRI